MLALLMHDRPQILRLYLEDLHALQQDFVVSESGCNRTEVTVLEGMLHEVVVLGKDVVRLLQVSDLLRKGLEAQTTDDTAQVF